MFIVMLQSRGATVSKEFIRRKSMSAARYRRQSEFVKAVLLDQLIMSKWFTNEEQIKWFIEHGKANIHRYSRVRPDVMSCVIYPKLKFWMNKTQWELFENFVIASSRFKLYSANYYFLNSLYGQDILSFAFDGSKFGQNAIERLFALIYFGRSLGKLQPWKRQFMNMFYLDRGAGMLLPLHMVRHLLAQQVSFIKEHFNLWRFFVFDTSSDFNPNNLQKYVKKFPLADTALFGKEKLTDKAQARMRFQRLTKVLNLLILFAASDVQKIRRTFQFGPHHQIVLEMSNNRLVMFTTFKLRWNEPKHSFQDLLPPFEYVKMEKVPIPSKDQLALIEELDSALVKTDIWLNDPKERPLKRLGRYKDVPLHKFSDMYKLFG